ncbi:MAG: VTT domain-containing protein [Desulfobacteraceae bacterium]|jgi:membrane protein DedA with SNARE-associated domain
MRVGSVIWLIAFALLLGGLGLPVPENPALVGGGYAIYSGVVETIPGLCLWYLAIICGDIVLFGVARWFFGRPSPSGWLKRWAGKKRFERYQRAFLSWGGWTLFLARFTFGIRAVAYFAAGAASYPWIRFLVVDSVSVAIQVLTFVGIGYYAGERVELAKTASTKIALLLSLAAILTLIFTWVYTLFVRRLSNRDI